MFNRPSLVWSRRFAALVATSAIFVALSIAPAAGAQTPAAAGSPGQQPAPAFVTRTELDRALARFAPKAEGDDLRAQRETLRARLNELKAEVANVKARLDGGEASVGAMRRGGTRDSKI